MPMTKSGKSTPADAPTKSLEAPVKVYPGSSQIKMGSGVVKGPGEALCHGSADKATT